MAAVKPSLILNFILDPRFSSDDMRAEMKRTYTYIAPARIHFFEANGTPEETSANEGSPQSASATSDAMPQSDDTSQVESVRARAPQHNEVIFNVVCHAPYWETGDAAQAYWSETLLPWVGKMANKLSKTVTAHNGVRTKTGSEPVAFTNLKIVFGDRFVIDIPLQSNKIDAGNIMARVDEVRLASLN